MATYTSNYGFTKPDGTDKVLIVVINQNMDKLDKILHDLQVQAIPEDALIAAIEAYFAENPPASGATTAQAAQIEANKNAAAANTAAINTLNGKVGQSVNTTSDVTFKTVTADKVVGAVYA